MLPRSTRFTRLSIALIATLAVLAGTAASSQAATAPCPPGTTAGNKLCLDMTRTPDAGSGFTFVSVSGVATYVVEVSNVSTATATKVTLRFDPPAGAKVLRLAPLPSSCRPIPTQAEPVAGPITCPLGNLKPGADLVFTFDVQMGVASDDARARATLSSDARAKDTGAGNPTDPTQETLIVEDGIEVDGTDGLGTSLVPQDLKFTLDTDSDHSGPTGPGDRRTAKFIFLADTFATTAIVQDEGVEDPFFDCPPGLKCPTGGWTEAFIPNEDGDLIFQIPGPFFPPDGVLRIELVYDVSTLPSNLTTKNYALIHDRDYDETTTDYEVVDDKCPQGNPQPSCLEEVRFLENGDLFVRALIDGNWRWR